LLQTVAGRSIAPIARRMDISGMNATRRLQMRKMAVIKARVTTMVAIIAIKVAEEEITITKSNTPRIEVIMPITLKTLC
jgi:hypothetical protein